MVAEFPPLSIRKAVSAHFISPTLVYKIYTDDLHLSVYKFHLWHKLEDKVYEKRVKFALWFLEKPASGSYHMIFSDEAYFYLTLPVNKQNNRIWSQSTTWIGVEQPLHDMKIPKNQNIIIKIKIFFKLFDLFNFKVLNFFTFFKVLIINPNSLFLIIYFINFL